MSTTLAQQGITPQKIQEYDQRIPRYTSYPTAPFWTEKFDAAAWRAHLQKHADSPADLSLYVHIPFCEKHCLFCACNVIITPKKEVAEDYLRYLEMEIRLVASLAQSDGCVTQLHLGGGTPNYLTGGQLARLMAVLGESFAFDPHADRSIEVDPRRATPDDIANFRRIGFRRISFGVQDFHEETQQAIRREQARDAAFLNTAAAREAGFDSVNIDLIYGLPRQTEQSWQASLDDLAALRPDRIALYNFAFLPTKLAHQRALLDEELPGPEQKLEMFIEAHNRLIAEGYEFIGMDHYALPDEALSRGLREGTLRRNFMGYTTLRGVDLLGFGTSAISDYHGAYAQNTKKLSEYKRALSEGVLPTERGLLLNDDDLLRQFIIEEVMCNGVLPLDVRPGVRAAVEAERGALEKLASDGMLELDEKTLRVTQKGRIFLRNIAVHFDAYLKKPGESHLFSRSV